MNAPSFSATTPAAAPRLEMRGIVKRYGRLVANDGIDLSIRPGEIHALMGENGAGKSTLMSVLFGLEQPDRGEIVIDGRPVRLRSPLDAIAHGVGMVHQSFRLFESLSVWENVVFRAEPRRGMLLDPLRACREVEALAARYGMTLDVRARVADLPLGVRQRIEILKALYRDTRLLVLDEPTAVLTPSEVEALFAVLRRLAAGGCAIILVTHKLAEVFAVSQRITVLSRGRVTARLATFEANEETLVRAMTGQAPPRPLARQAANLGLVRLEVDRLVVEEDGRRVVDAASFSVRAGEVVGIAGVAGNGQSELIEALVGLRRTSGGRVALCGGDVTHLSVAARRQAGLAHVAEDRARTGSAARASAVDTLAMGFHRRTPLARRGVVSKGAWRDWARTLIARFDVRIASETTRVGSLSGGNLQKLVIARELAHAAPVLLAEQPTRGVDVGAVAVIHAALMRERARGQAILLVSSELSEILALSDRVLVMFAGRIVADVDCAAADEASLGLLMAGGRTVRESVA